jgi:hypothetical protein
LPGAPRRGNVVPVSRGALIRLLLAVAICAPLALAILAGPATARDGGDGRAEVRERGVCGRGGEARLRLRADHGAIRADTEIRTSRTGIWRLTILHERRIVVRARIRVTRSNGGVRHRDVFPDYVGADTVSVRAVAPSGETCSVVATLPGSS